MKYKNEYNKISEILNKSNNVLIITHIDPDPDGLCSSHAIALVIQQMKKKCNIALQHELIKKYSILIPDSSLPIYELSSDINYDLIITLDLGSKKRSGKYIELFNKNIPIINIDHHLDNDHFGEINIIDASFSSTSELMYEFFKDQKIPINQEIATALYIGIVFDTGSFRYSLTTSKTHKYVSELLEYKIDTNDIYEMLFERVSQGALRLMSKVSSTLEIFCNGKVAIISLRKAFYDECNANESDNTLLVRLGSSIEGVDLSIFINEKEENLIKVSLRSKYNFKVNEIAKQFGGGGHEKAAGFIIEDNYKNVKEIIINKIISSYSKTMFNDILI